MASKLVAVVDTNSSKADEVAALRKMAQCAGEGSYLASLLTPQLLDWVEGQIELDLPPDIVAERQFQADKRVELMTEVSSLRKELADADRKAGWAAKEVEAAHQCEIDDLRGKLRYMSGLLDLSKERLQQESRKAHAYRDAVLYVWGFLSWMMGKRDEAERLVDRAKLKAFAMLAKVL